MIIKSGVASNIFTHPGPWHYAIVDGCVNYFEIVDWCLDNFGIDGFHNWVSDVERTSYFFKDENHLILFVLRWS